MTLLTPGDRIDTMCVHFKATSLFSNCSPLNKIFQYPWVVYLNILPSLILSGIFDYTAFTDLEWYIW